MLLVWYVQVLAHVFWNAHGQGCGMHELYTCAMRATLHICTAADTS